MKKQILLAVPFMFGAVSADSDNGSSQKDKYCGIEVSAGVSCQYSNSDVWGRYCDVAAPDAAFNRARYGHIRGTKLGGSLGIAYGAFFGNARFGLGAGVDLTGNKSSTQDFRGYMNGNMDLGLWKLKSRGIVPTVYVSAGYYLCAIDALVGIKGGLTYLYSELSTDGSMATVKNKGVTPMVGLFLQKNVYGGFNLGVELDYRLGISKRVEGYDMKTRANGQFASNDVVSDHEMKSRGYVVRVVCAYNF